MQNCMLKGYKTTQQSATSVAATNWSIYMCNQVITNLCIIDIIASVFYYALYVAIYALLHLHNK